MSEIILSDIEIIPIRPQQGLLAFCTFVLNGDFFVGDVSIYSRLSGSGYRLVYPAKTLPNGAKINTFHPINKEAAQAIDEQVIGAFKELMKKVKTDNERNV